MVCKLLQYLGIGRKQNSPAEALLDPSLLVESVKNSLGTTYNTAHSVYSIDNEGRFHGRPSLEGAQVEGVTGGEVSHVHASIFFNSGGYAGAKDFFLKFLSAHPTRPSPGDNLFILLTEESARKTGRVGFISSPIKAIIQEKRG